MLIFTSVSVSGDEYSTMNLSNIKQSLQSNQLHEYEARIMEIAKRALLYLHSWAVTVGVL